LVNNGISKTELQLIFLQNILLSLQLKLQILKTIVNIIEMCQFMDVRLLQNDFEICLLFHLKRSNQHTILILLVSRCIIALGRSGLIDIFLSWRRNINGTLHLLTSHLFIHIAVALSLIKPLPFLIPALLSIPLAYQLLFVKREHQGLPLLVFYRPLYTAQPQVVGILILEAKVS
jgi:hypothetical protein